MPDPLPIEVIAARIARLALAEHPSIGRLGPGPVLTVVRDTTSGKIYVGLNTGFPKKLSDVLYKAILAQGARVWQSEVNVVRTDPEAVGGHSEVNALNPAILDRQRVLGRKLTEADLAVFELHNLWISGGRSMTAAARCEHCARITRGVAVTRSGFVAEGGVVGEVNVPQRGSVVRSRSPASTPVTTAEGETNVPQRGSVTRSGSRASTPVTTASGPIGESHAVEGGFRGAMAPALVSGVLLISEPFIKRWIFKTFMQEGWAKHERDQVAAAIERMTPLFNVLVQSHSEQIQKAKGAGRGVKLRIDVNTDWFDTSYGPYQAGAYVIHWDLVFEGDIEVEVPLIQPSNFWHDYFRAARASVRRQTFYIVL